MWSFVEFVFGRSLQGMSRVVESYSAGLADMTERQRISRAWRSLALNVGVRNQYMSHMQFVQGHLQRAGHGHEEGLSIADGRGLAAVRYTRSRGLETISTTAKGWYAN